MTEAWKSWEGQTVDGFPLRQYLGGSDHSAVYLTQLSDFPPKNVAIKFILAEASADAQLARWRVAGELKHPNLLQLIRVGRCHLANSEFLYVVMEFAEEDLSQILPQRSLEPNEARQMLESLLEALTYLHGQGLAHTRIKPGNILATGDQLKISSDTLCEIGSAPLVRAESTIYTAPESAAAPVSAAADIWSLGVTVVEALTQRTPVVRNQLRTELPVPETIPPPYLEIARRSVQMDPARRASLQEIATLLNPEPAIKPQLKKDPALVPGAVHVTPAETVKKSLAAQHVAVTPHTLVPAATTRTAESPRKSRVAVPLLAVIIIIAAILAAPRVLNRFSQLQPHADTVQPTIAPASELLDSPPIVTKPPVINNNAGPKNLNKPAAVDNAPADKGGKAASAKQSLGGSAMGSESPTKPSRASQSNPAHGAVLYQVVPDVSPRARETILGTVHVNVRVHVDASGNVVGADLDNGSSRFFGDQAVQVSRRWTFTPPQVNGHNAPSEWLLRYEFSPTATKVFPTQTNP
jgi:serine/threonine-protein kinase